MNVKAVVQSLLEKDKNLNEETSRHWDEILGRAYVFDRSVRDAETVGQLSQVCGFPPPLHSVDNGLAGWVSWKERETGCWYSLWGDACCGRLCSSRVFRVVSGSG